MPRGLTDAGSTRAWRTIRRRVMTRDRWRCQWCGSPAETVGHIVARRHGGTDDMSNLAAQCWRCQREEPNLREPRRVTSPYSFGRTRRA